MRKSATLLIIAAGVAVGIARAQTAAPRPQPASPAAGAPALPTAAAPAREPKAAHQARSSPAVHSRGRVAGAPKRGPAPKGDAILDLGATDITGNKELPKVMVIVPWKDASGAGGVIKPTDSLMNEVLGPVDRGVFQRRIRYYGQLRAIEHGSAQEPVAPAGDRH